MKATIVFLAFVIVLALVLFRVKSESGLDALMHSRDAVRQAKSWTTEITSQGDPPTVTNMYLTQVSCPADFKALTRTTQDGLTKEHISMRFHGNYYEETLEGVWRKTGEDSKNEPMAECGVGPLVGSGAIYSTIEELKRRGRITKGMRQMVEGIRCQEWNIDGGYEWPPMPSYSVCIEPESHLPRRIRYRGGGEFLMFGWNMTTIVPPLPSELETANR